jgi:gamma-glutamylcyclotransferase (GGCT)/AIG2-like uncharacterized protein YtfP
MKTEASEIVFVYGTLKAGGENHRLLDACTPIGVSRLRGGLYNVGAYPTVVLEEDGFVTGEVYRCPRETIRELDTFEGVGEGLFSRVTVDIGEQPCWVYVAGPLLLNRLRWLPRIASGTWPTR